MITTLNEFKDQLNENNSYDYFWSQFHGKIWKSPISGWKWNIKSVNNDYYNYDSDIDANFQTAIDAEMDMMDFCDANIGSKPDVQVNELKQTLNETSDHEVSMANNSLDTIIQMATELKTKIGTDEIDIPAWIQDHIAKAENYIAQANQNYYKTVEAVYVFDNENDDDDDDEWNNVSKLTDELNRLIRWRNEYGKGADSKIEKIRNRIEFLNNNNK